MLLFLLFVMVANLVLLVKTVKITNNIIKTRDEINQRLAHIKSFRGIK